MYTAFISSGFFKNLRENKGSKYFESFILDFFSKLNLNFIITDIDFLKINPDLFDQLSFRSFFNYGNGEMYRISNSLDGMLSDSKEKLHKLINNQEINDVKEENRIYFVHINKDIIQNSDLRSLAIISSACFDYTFEHFLLNGKVRDSIRYSDYVSKKVKLNVWSCPGTNRLLIDDPYLLVKKEPGKIDHGSVSKRVEEILKDFASYDIKQSRIFVIHIPTNENNSYKFTWQEKEKNDIEAIINKVVNKICPGAKCKIIFHSLSTHARFVLSNRYLFELSAGFDYLRKSTETLKETNDTITYSSIYLLDKNDVLQGLYNNRVRKTDAINYFPQADV